MKMRYNITNKSFDKGIGAELYPTFYLAAMGKIKFFDDLFCVRQNHERRIILKKLSQIINNKKFKKSVDILIKNISSHIKKDNLKFKNVKKKMTTFFKIMKNQFWKTKNCYEN